jgi:DNA-binding NtrC family response regulator
VTKKTPLRQDETREIISQLRALTTAYSDFQQALKELYKRGCIRQKTWKRKILPSDGELHQIIAELWKDFDKKMASGELPTSMLREDQVAQTFHVSRKTLYRRRKSGELGYIKDRHGILWYSAEELENYLQKHKVLPLRKRARKI